MVADLHCRPPLVAAVLEVVGDRAGQVRADYLPRDGQIDKLPAYTVK